MWGSLLGLSLLIALNPLLLGLILLIISRPRPMQNLLAFWAGALVTNIPLFLVPLLLLHVTPAFASFAEGLTSPETAALSTIRPIPLATGVFALSVAALITRRHRVIKRANVPASGGDSSTMVLESEPPAAKTSPLGRAGDAVMGVASAIRRQLDRLGKLWENGALWVALVFGMLYLPSLSLVLLIDSTIVASGVRIGTQLSAAIAFVVGYLAVVEITLLSYFVAPARTEAILGPAHEWARAHNRQILITFFALVGFWQLAQGLGLIYVM